MIPLIPFQHTLYLLAVFITAIHFPDVLPDLATMEEDCELRDAAAQLRQLVTALPEREQRILTLRYGLNGAVPQTQQQIAAQFGISRSYVSRLEKHALARLRRAWNQPHPL